MVERRLILSVIVSLLVSVLISTFMLSVFTTDIYRTLPESLRDILEIMGFFVCPVAPIIYGWVARDKIGAIIVGVVPFLGFFLFWYLNIVKLHGIPSILQIILLIIHIGIISLFGGLAGYFASKRKREYLAIAVVSAILWVSFLIGALIGASTPVIIAIVFTALCFWVLIKASS